MDIELVIAAQRGDEGAFASLAQANGGRLHAVAHRILRDLDLAEDATQQALLAIWQDLPKLRDPAQFEAWSYPEHALDRREGSIRVSRFRGWNS